MSVPSLSRDRRTPSGAPTLLVVGRLGEWADQWDRLLDDAGISSPFLRSWWLDEVGGDDPLTLLVLAGEELVGGVALERDRLLGIERLRFRGSGPLQPDHLDLVAASGHEHDVVACVAGWLGRPGDRLIDLEGLDHRAWLLDAVPGWGPVLTIEVAPYVVLPETASDYLASRPGQMRSTITRTAKRLDKAGVETRVVATADLDRGLGDLRRLHDGRWGDDSGFLGHWEQFTKAVRRGHGLGQVRLTELVDPEHGVIATEIDFVVANRVSFYQAGRRTDREFRGAGSVLRYRIIAAAIEHGATEFDLLRGGENYKTDWASADRPVLRVRRGVGPRGRAVAMALEANRRRSERRGAASARPDAPAGPGESISVVIYSDAEQVGGAERQTMQLLAGLDASFVVTVVGVDRRVVEQLASARHGVATYVLAPIRNKADVGAVRAHRALFRRLGPSIVHAQMGHGSSCQYAMLAALSVPGVRVVATEHSPMGVWSRSSRWVKRAMVGRLAAHVAVGRAAAGLVAGDIGIAPTRLQVIPNGVAPLAVRDAPRMVDGPVIGVVARFDPVKGVDLAIDALALLDGVTLVIVGDGPLRAELESQVHRLGLDARVRFLGWVEEPRALLAAFDLLVLPSRLEGMPVSIIEAMLAGVAVVATDVGSVGEVVLDGETGRVVPPGDAVALAAAVRELLDDPPRRLAMGVAGRERAEQHFSSAAVVAAYEALYRRVVSRQD